MKKKIFRYLKHAFLTLFALAIIAISFGLYHGASASYGHDPKRIAFDGEGPYAFYKNDSTISVKYIKGMFAFAIWDQYKLFLARDRMGIKPLFYTFLPSENLF